MKSFFLRFFYSFVLIVSLVGAGGVEAGGGKHDREEDGYEGEPSEKRGKADVAVGSVDEGVETAVASYIITHLQKQGKPMKTKAHKLTYFANGLHYALTGNPMITTPFTAHQYGSYSESVKALFEKRIIPEYILRSEVMEICDVVTECFHGWTANKLTELTHEEGTPWSQARKASYLNKIDPNKDREYFTHPDIVFRLFMEPYLVGTITKNAGVFERLVQRYPGLIEGKLEFLCKERLVQNKMPPDHVRLPDHVGELLNTYKGIETYRPLLETDISHMFFHKGQPLMQGIVAEWIFPEDFIEDAEINLYFNEEFRERIALAASLGHLPALYALKRVFEMFSEGEEDNADSHAKQVESRLERVIKILLGEIPTQRLHTQDWQVSPESKGIYPRVHTSTDEFPYMDVGASTSSAFNGRQIEGEGGSSSEKNISWRSAYAEALAHFYNVRAFAVTESEEKFISLTKHFLGQPDLVHPMPIRYQKDWLKRAYFFNPDPDYIQQGLRLGDPQFYLYQIAEKETAEEAFTLLEKALQETALEFPEVLYETAKLILQESYNVPEESFLWKRWQQETVHLEMQQGNGEGSSSAAQQSSQGLEAWLLEKAAVSGFEPALVLYLSTYHEDLEQGLRLCEKCYDQADNMYPWAAYQAAKIYERQGRIQDAIEAYKKAGFLLGYPDAARLASPEEEKSLLHARNAYKARVVEELFETFNQEYL